MVVAEEGIRSREAAEAQVQAWLREYGGADLSLPELVCDRHAQTPDRLALLYEDAAGRASRLTFAELREHSTRLAGLLQNLGVGRGDRVAALLPRSPELMITVVAIWRLGAVHVPLFTAFGPDAIAYRAGHSGATVIVTDATNRPKIPEGIGALADA